MSQTLSLDRLAPGVPATLVSVTVPADSGIGVASAGATAGGVTPAGNALVSSGPPRGAAGDDVQGLHEVARRLVELGFVEGDRVRVVRRGFPFGDPIAVRIGSLTIALRRFEAALVVVRLD